ncbi:MAG: hypothetical protein IT577_13860 [Verrucomicrobiae bacterium]|nr:hypothetical protein [Verrucomicrobiae bacterium]
MIRPAVSSEPAAAAPTAASVTTHPAASAAGSGSAGSAMGLIPIKAHVGDGDAGRGIDEERAAEARAAPAAGTTISALRAAVGQRQVVDADVDRVAAIAHEKQPPLIATGHRVAIAVERHVAQHRRQMITDADRVQPRREIDDMRALGPVRVDDGLAQRSGPGIETIADEERVRERRPAPSAQDAHDPPAQHSAACHVIP